MRKYTAKNFVWAEFLEEIGILKKYEESIHPAQSETSLSKLVGDKVYDTAVAVKLADLYFTQESASLNLDFYSKEEIKLKGEWTFQLRSLWTQDEELFYVVDLNSAEGHKLRRIYLADNKNGLLHVLKYQIKDANNALFIKQQYVNSMPDEIVEKTKFQFSFVYSESNPKYDVASKVNDLLEEEKQEEAIELFKTIIDESDKES